MNYQIIFFLHNALIHHNSNFSKSKYFLLKLNNLIFLRFLFLTKSDFFFKSLGFLQKNNYFSTIIFCSFLFSKKFVKSFDFLKFSFSEKDLSINLKPFYVKRFWKKYFKKKKLRFKKWPKLIKKFLKKKLRRKYRYVVLNYKNKIKKFNFSSHLFNFLNFFEKTRNFNNPLIIFYKRLLPINTLSSIFRMHDSHLLNNFVFFKTQELYFFKNKFSVNKYNFNMFLKKRSKNTNIQLWKKKLKIKNKVAFKYKIIEKVIKQNESFFFFQKNILLFNLKIKIHKKPNTFAQKYNPRLKNIFLRKMLLNDIVKFDLFKMKKNAFFLSNTIFHFFFYKNIAFSKSGLLPMNKPLSGVYDNFTPINCLYKPLRRLIFKRFQKSYTPDFFKYFNLFVFSYLEYFLKAPIFFKIQSRLKITNIAKKSLRSIFFRHKNLQNKVGRGFFFFEMLEIIWLSSFHKDLNFLISWFLKTINRIPFKRHKKLLSVFKFIITKYGQELLFSNNVKGFFFDIRGKVGVSGNAKKRHFSFYNGKYSKTTKNSKFDYKHNIVRTYTGALGVTFILYY